MFEVVENTLQNDVMLIGVGAKEHEPALRKLGCESFILARDFEEALSMGLPTFRRSADDIVMMINPRLIAPVSIRRCLDQDVPIQVVGHEPQLPRDQKGRKALRALRATMPDGEADPKAPGRPPEIIAPKEAVEDGIKWWREGAIDEKGRWKSVYTPTAIVAKLKQEYGLKVEKHWARDQAFARFNSYKRNPNLDPK